MIMNSYFWVKAMEKFQYTSIMAHSLSKFNKFNIVQMLLTVWMYHMMACTWPLLQYQLVFTFIGTMA